MSQQAGRTVTFKGVAHNDEMMGWMGVMVLPIMCFRGIPSAPFPEIFGQMMT